MVILGQEYEESMEDLGHVCVNSASTRVIHVRKNSQDVNNPNTCFNYGVTVHRIAHYIHYASWF